MRKVRLSLLVAGLLFAGAACSSGGDGASDGSATDDTSASVPAADDGSVAPTPAGGGDAECLQGTWVSGPEHLQEFISALGSPMTMTVMPDSVSTLVIDGSTIDLDSTITLQASISDTVMQMTGGGHYAGTFSADASTINVTLTVQDVRAGDWMMTAGGETVAMPGMAPLSMAAPIGGVGTYTCTATTLVTVASGYTSTYDRS